MLGFQADGFESLGIYLCPLGLLRQVPQTWTIHNRRLLSPRAGGWKAKAKAAAGWFLLRPLFLGSQVAVFSPCLHTVFPLRVRVLISSSHRDSSLIGLGPILKTSFYLTHPFKYPVFEYSHVLRNWGLGLQHANWGRHTIQHPCLLKVPQVTKG